MIRARATPPAVAITWTPGWHAKWLERALLPLGLVTPARRNALEALLQRNRPEERVDRAFAIPTAPSRYSDGSHPAFYAAKDATTAFFEKLHHDAGQLRKNRIGPHAHAIELLHVTIAAIVDDIRLIAASDQALTDPTDYTACQALAHERFSEGAHGLLYPSVRDAGADCAVIFVRSGIADARVFKSVSVEWDGTDFILDRSGTF